FQAGYPKTPLFDGTCRPAELAYLLLGGTDHAGPYKLTVALGCLLAPLAFVAAARGLGQPPPAAPLAGGLGLAAFRAAPPRQLLVAGDLDWLFGGLALVAHLGLLVRYERCAPLVCWLGLLLTTAAGATTHPLLWLGFAPLGLAFWFGHALRHGPAWHLGLGPAWLGGAAAQADGLPDAGGHWGTRLPVLTDAGGGPLESWGGTGDQVLAGGLAAGALLGLFGRPARPTAGVRL